MKKILCCLILAFLFIPVISIESQENEPIFVHDIYPHFFVGPFVCEYAIDGDVDMIRIVEPYVHSGRLYFLGIALPISSGSLRQDFEFNVDLFEDTPRIRAVYHGTLRDPITREHTENGVFVAGYAQRGSIIITNVFFDMETANRWASTVRLASD